MPPRISILVLILLIQVGAITLHHYPLFFALATKYKLIGGVLGLFFMVGKYVSFYYDPKLESKL